nr:reverse transcriptase domain-containing protein [Tanacetum cinerariifolium]
NSVIKLILFPFSLAGAARRWIEKEPPCSITTWDDLVSKFINEFFPPSRTTNLRNEISNFQQKFDESFHEACERSSSRLTRDQTSNPTSSTNTTPKGRNRRSSKQKVKNSNLEEHLPPVVMMADNRTMAELLRAPTEGYAEAIVVPPILADQFELKHSLIDMMTTDQFLRLDKDNPHDHIPDQDSLNAAAGGNLLERSTQHVLTIIENKSKVHNSRSKPITSQVKACDTNSNSEIAKLTQAVNQQTSAMTTAMTAMLKQFQATSPPAPVKGVEEICVTCGS